jgi:hypothetical protein
MRLRLDTDTFPTICWFVPKSDEDWVMTVKNLDNLHESVRSSVETYCERLISVLGSNLKSIAVYGSATGPDFIPGRSNVNLVVVLEHLDQSALEALLAMVKWGKKKNIVPPLLLTPGYIEASLDVFPIEFMDIRQSQALLVGEDHFSKLEVRPEHVRLECESQLKAAVLRTRQAFLEVGLAKKGAEAVLHASLTSLIPVFRAMLRLKGRDVPVRKVEVVDAVGKAFGVDPGPFKAILHDKVGDEKIGGKEAHHVLADYVGDIEQLARKIDEI